MISVPYVPVPNIEPNECFLEVARHCKENGGKSVYCWLVWDGELFDTHLHHTLWEKPDKTLCCIVPQFLHNYLERYEYKGDRKVILDEQALPIAKDNRLYSLPSKHIPKVKEKWCIAACRFLDEEYAWTNEAWLNNDYSLLPLAEEAHSKANYWIARGTKDRFYSPLNTWLYAMKTNLANA